jgi:hypothetical protein
VIVVRTGDDQPFAVLDGDGLATKMWLAGVRLGSWRALAVTLYPGQLRVDLEDGEVQVVPIVGWRLRGDGALLFDMPDGRTVVVTGSH